MKKLLQPVFILISVCLLLISCSGNPSDKDTYVVYNGITVEGKDQWLYYAGDSSIGIYKGLNIYSIGRMQDYLDMFRRLDLACRDRGKTVVFMAQPNKEIVYSEHMPDLTIYSERRRADILFDYLHSRSDINAIYPLSELTAAKEDYQVYYAHDTHWNSMGAFIGMQTLYGTLGLPTTDPASLGPVETAVSGGDLIDLGNLDPDDYPADVDYQIPYKTDVQYTRYETKGGNILFTEVADAEFDSGIAYIGDSFRTAVIPFVTKDFSRTVFVDLNGLEDPDALKAICESDIIVIAFVERYIPNIMHAVQTLFSLLTE